MAAQEWFRSQKMEYLSLVVQEELAHACMTELGALGMFQVVDLLPHKTAFQRRYINEISRIDAVERKVRYIEEMLEKHEIQLLPAPSTEELLLHLKKRSEEGQTPNALLLDFEALLAEKERELKIVASLQANLTSEFNKSVELKHVLQSLAKLARDDPNIPHGATNVTDHEDEMGGGLQNDPLSAIRFRFLAGTIANSEKSNFERMIFRTTRGNAYMRFDDIAELLVDPITSTKMQKSVFVVFFQAKVMEDKIIAVCRAFQAQTYALPGIDSSVEIVQQYDQTVQELQERTVITRRNTEDLYRLLGELARHVLAWKLTLRKEKSVYHALNSMDSSVTGVLRCEGWVTSAYKDVVSDCINAVHRRHNLVLPNWVTVIREDQRPSKAPTYYKVNKFTAAFQVVIDTYGIARYQEVNPSLFATVTFPFCFGVMFGDVGHGFALFLFSLALLWKEKELGKMELNEVAALLYSGRYVLALMSVFSMYCGFIYNDAMSLGLALFPPTWQQPSGSLPNETVYYVRDSKNPQVYPFGADPTWKLATSEIAFYNSFKMKFAVIFGVLHMLVGLVLKGMNAIHFHKGKKGPNLDLWFECVPQILFMCLLFGYMDFLIIYKWCIPWGDSCDRGEGMCQPPSIITTMISMALSPGTVKDPMFAGQARLQVFLVLAAVCCVPIMLCVKPYILVKRMNQAHGHASHAHSSEEMPLNDAQSDGGRSTSDLLGGGGHTSAMVAPMEMVVDEHGGGGGHGEEEHSVGDIVIHQAIETIEFVLGSISNTASYLRLWALSLAHSQLAAVFWERTLMPFLVGGSSAKQIIGTYIGCAVFFAVTFVVLMCMDNLECFLHTLRLHWVEFMNKFFKAEGMKFEPLSFEEIFEDAKRSKTAN
ncbi:hypothetical protein BASA81_002599 [Batrachochytrium salamandrivorans]|nr:hypothetical protein BASA81_002599 [Batrachochytrium salamandrivorans]